MTDPDSLGPCEPGTAVKLEGIVYHETEKGKRITSVKRRRCRRRSRRGKLVPLFSPKLLSFTWPQSAQVSVNQSWLQGQVDDSIPTRQRSHLP